MVVYVGAWGGNKWEKGAAFAYSWVHSCPEFGPVPLNPGGIPIINEQPALPASQPTQKGLDSQAAKQAIN